MQFLKTWRVICNIQVPDVLAKVPFLKYENVGLDTNFKCPQNIFSYLNYLKNVSNNKLQFKNNLLNFPDLTKGHFKTHAIHCSIVVK